MEYESDDFKNLILCDGGSVEDFGIYAGQVHVRYSPKANGLTYGNSFETFPKLAIFQKIAMFEMAMFWT